jgi:GH25 family lysozyme M1 (1,4-beta-N-acetylmuramidase)
MSLSITSPKDGDAFDLGVRVTFKGKADNGIVRVEIFAEQWHLGRDDVESGEWTLTYPGFTGSGVRHIRVIGLDQNGNTVDTVGIDLILEKPGFQQGLDVSDFDGTVNWQRVKSVGYTFAFAKATEGKTWRAETFPRNWRQMEGVGIIRGAYHFFRPKTDAKAQAENFLDYINSVDPIGADDLPPVIDLEHYPPSVRQQWNSISKSERVKRVQAWIDVIESEIKRKPIIYTSYGFWNGWMQGVRNFSNYPLWVAHYTPNPQPLIPNEWNRWTFWQYSDRAEIPGISPSREDVNRFNGSLSDLIAFIPNDTVIV